MKWGEFSSTEMGAMYDRWNDRLLEDYLDGSNDDTGEDERGLCECCHDKEALERFNHMWLCADCLINEKEDSK